MSKEKTVGLVFMSSCLAVGALWVWHARAGSPGVAESPTGRPTLDMLASGVVPGRRPVDSEANAVEAAPLPSDVSVPKSAEDLAGLVAWMRGLGPEELLRLSNAEYGFAESALVEMLQDLEGPWVVRALGDLALAEGDPLIKAVLVEGLVGAFRWERVGDAELLPVIDSLLSQMSLAAEDPYDVAHGLAFMGYAACAKSGQDYGQLLAAHLPLSDNPQLLRMGFTLLGKCPGGKPVLKQMLFAHPSPDGRMGALEGLRNSTLDGGIPPSELTALGLSALAEETNGRNRLLLYEMMISAGGEQGVSAVEMIVRTGQAAEISQTVEMLAMKMEPARALALFQELLAERELDGEGKQALYNALALVEGAEGVDYLLERVNDPELEDAERLAGLRGLRNREVDERLAGELRTLFETAEDGELRMEALRMLAWGENEAAGIDLRDVGALDEDAGVRAEAVMLAGLDATPDTRVWLESRLQQDSSLEVKASALGALVYHAHYAGDGEGVLDYLARARKFTDDEEALSMIAEGERMVQDFDPRRIDLDLAKEAEFWSMAAGYTSGPARRNFQRQAQFLERTVNALRHPTR